MYIINILEEMGGIHLFLHLHHVIRGRIDRYNNRLKKLLFGRNCIIHRRLVGTVLSCTMELLVFRVDNATTHIYV